MKSNIYYSIPFFFQFTIPLTLNPMRTTLCIRRNHAPVIIANTDQNTCATIIQYIPLILGTVMYQTPTNTKTIAKNSIINCIFIL